MNDSRAVTGTQPIRVLTRHGLKDDKPVIMYCGKLYPGKRPLDLVDAVGLLPGEVNTLFVGDGSLADQIRAALPPGNAAVTGFINQSDLPAYYHAADILVLPSQIEMWGLVINEGMAAGSVPRGVRSGWLRRGPGRGYRRGLPMRRCSQPCGGAHPRPAARAGSSNPQPDATARRSIQS